MARVLTLLFIVTVLITGTHAQTVIVNENCKTAYSNILSLKFEDARKNIEVEKIKNPQNIFIPYLENYIDFLKVTISENEDLFNSLEEKVNDRFDKIKKHNDTSKFKKYFLGNINLQWATARVKFGEYPTAALEINRAYRLLVENDRLFPDFTPNSITLGILHIMIGIIPDSYNWILDLISMQGSVIQGQNELKQAFEECQINSTYNFLGDEILFYMGMVGLSLNPDPEFANYLISNIGKSENGNLMLTYLNINTLMKTGKNDLALKLFPSIDTLQNYYPFYYLDYLHGECFLRELNTGMAKKEYDKFITNFTGRNYIKNAWQRLAWISLIDGDTVGYYKAMQNVLVRGDTKIDGDKSAERAAKNSVVPNVDLIKCRLLSDGGYYNQAQNILFNLNDEKLPTTDIVEKNYRLGRIAHQMNNYPDAKIYYGITIETGSSLPLYFAANAALKLGNIYEVENDPIRATHYYKLCLDMDFDEYRNSIRGKAKQGLKRVGGT